METADLLTLFTRTFAALCLTIFAAVYAVRGEWIPAVLFFLIAAVVWRLAVSLYRKMRTPQGAEPPEEKR